MTYIARIALLLSLGLSAPAALAVDAGEPATVPCQDQKCKWSEGSGCFQCTSEGSTTNFACHPGPGQCPQDCTESRCAKKAPAPSQKSFGSSGCSSFDAGLGQLELDPLDLGTRPAAKGAGSATIGSLDQEGAPVEFVGMTVSTVDLLHRSEFYVADRPVTSFQIAWIATFEDGHQELGTGREIELEAPAAREVVALDRQHVPFSLVSIAGARNVAFFISDVRFTDGELWSADVRAIKERLALNL